MKNLLLYFVLAYGISWLIWLPLWLPYLGISGLPALPDQHYLGSYGPALAALIVLYVTRGKEGVRGIWGRVFLWRVAPVWYAVVFGGMFLLFIAGALIAQEVNGQAFTLHGFGVNREFPALNMMGYFLMNLLTFGFGEEIGWRGFALPELQRRFNALWSTLILTLFWAAWHTPAFFYRPGYSSMGAGDIAGFFFSILTGSVVLTWLYNSTKGSILIVALLHAMVEMIFVSDNITPEISMYEGMLFMLAAIVIVFWTKPMHLSRLPRQQNTS
ncbi:MAG: CPBP family intramembrane metalloprotease [Saprospiraceae bacterium]|nr:CPBP family intramembrane metalloprotease [Saprospiraceae bacterium]